jgi:hypothetical protein
MRDFTKSLTSYTWAMSVFGIQQMFSLIGLGGNGQSGRATQAFTNVTEATSIQLGDTMRSVFRTGDNLQRAVVDLFLAPLNLGNGCGAAGDRGGPGTGRGWADTAAQAAAAGADVIQAAAASTGRAAQRTAETPGAQTRSAPPAADPSIGWGPMPR